MRGRIDVNDGSAIHPRLIIFARYPAPGRVKSRLIPALGEDGAARLQDNLTRHTLDEAATLAAHRRIDVEVRFTGAPVSAMRHRYGAAFTYVDQGGGDLGERLARAASAAAQSDRPIVIIGSDCPSITAGVLESAFAALTSRDVVIGPALDGGYYLVGFRRFTSELFANIPWSTSDVCATTCRAVERAGLTYALLGQLGDIDVPADLGGELSTYQFDRRNLELDVPALANGAELDVEAVLRQRLG